MIRQIIGEGLLMDVEVALSNGKTWMAYNTVPYFLEKGDMEFFTNKNDAVEFSIDNYSDHDEFKVFHATSILDVYSEIASVNKPSAQETSVINQESISDPDANPLYNRDGNGFTDALIGHIEQQQLFHSQLKTNTMNNENFKFLSDNLKYAGFGEDHKANLEKAMKEGKPEFQLQFSTEFNKKPFEATLNFRKSDSTDMYFFNSYNASLTRNDGEKAEQKFYLNNGKGITAKEAFNLLDGRAVHKDLVTKEGQGYKAWLQLNPEVRDKNGNAEVKQIHEKYGYNLEEAVGKFAVAELADAKKKGELIASLQKGNVQSITIEKEGSAHKMYMEADPRFKTVKLYDANMKLVTKENMSRYQAVGQGAAVKAVKEEGKDKQKELNQEKKPDKLKAEKKADKSLLPKKRQSTKKGLSVA